MIRIQREMSKEVVIRPLDFVPKRIGGFDLSYPRKDIALAVCVVLSYPDLELIEMKWTEVKVEMPYIPTFLSFREGPAIEKVYGMIEEKPDLLFFDGQGIAHPRGAGIASYMALKFHKPSIGVAKSHLFGEYKDPGKLRGDFEYIYSGSEVIGVVLRTKDNVKPLFVSPGSFVDFKDCADYTLNSCKGYRLPEPTRLADMYTKKLRKEMIL
ncbi:MAG: endonuclease V [Athalassotoga sp.]